MIIKAGAASTAILVAGLLACAPSLAGDLLQGASDVRPDPQAASEAMIVAADQLNDVDRSLHEGGSPPATSVNPPTVPVAAEGRGGSTWDHTSLIGKIFIGLGALLTVASAVRMFIV